MGSAHFLLIINVSVALCFASAYVAVAVILPSQRKALWFALAYCVGMIKPLADALLAQVSYPELVDCIGYGGFLAGLLMMSPALRIFHDLRPQWRIPATMLVSALVLRGILFTWDRTSLAHGIAYQLPFVAAAVLGCWTVCRVPDWGRIHAVLLGLFAFLALQFCIKPWIAVSVGAGQTLGDYVSSRYALISHSATGILLMAVGLALLLLIAQRAIMQSNLLAELDPLSGLLNRRGFERRAAALVKQSDIVALVIDIDHFKLVNDLYGHAVGDQVIEQFGRVLLCAAPADALVARLGGEEFVVLLPGTLGEGQQVGEAVRTAACARVANLPVITVSIGIAALQAGSALQELLQSADTAVYAAKRAGRDQIASVPLLQQAA